MWPRRLHPHPNGWGCASLGKRLLTVYVVASLLSILVAAAVLELMLNLDLPGGVAHVLDHAGGAIDRKLVFDAGGQPTALRLPADKIWVSRAAPREVKYRIVNEHGLAVLGSDPGAPPLARAGAPFDSAPGTFAFVDDGVLMHVQTFAFAHDGHPYWVQVAVSERAALLFRHAFIGPLLKNALWIATVALVLFAIGMHFTLERMLKPLRDASEAASRIAPRNLDARLATAIMPQELRPLTEAFNQALDRIEKGYRVQQEFLASAAHELKTPLALMRGQVELSESAERESLLRDIDMMARQVHQLLHLAEASEVTNYVFEEVDVGRVAGEATAFLQRLARRATVHLDLRLPPAPVALRADQGALFVLVKNLAENAIQHSPSGAVVTLVVDAGGIVVRDEGSGIAPEHLGRVFARFWRGPARRDSGAGLGLPICQEIALAHGWALTAGNGAVGAEFRVRFAAA